MKNIILLADNDENYRQTWAKLIRNAGYEVIEAAAPAQARKLLKSAKVDLAILDQRLEDDRDPNDTSGLKIAFESTFSFIPKIILTAYSIRMAEVNRLMGVDGDGLPAVVKIIEKGENFSVLLAAIEQSLELWPRQMRTSAVKVAEQIESDYRSTQQQAKYNFSVSAFVSLLGFIMIFTGIGLAWLDRLTIGIVGTASGMLVEVLGYLFFRRLDAANQRMDSYHDELLQTYRLEYLLAASVHLPAEKQVTAIEKALHTATTSWLGARGTVQAGAAAPETDKPIP